MMVIPAGFHALMWTALVTQVSYGQVYSVQTKLLGGGNHCASDRSVLDQIHQRPKIPYRVRLPVQPPEPMRQGRIEVHHVGFVESVVPVHFHRPQFVHPPSR